MVLANRHDKRFPEGVRQFYERHIDSVELLLVLILLHDEPTRLWTIERITDELRSSETSVEKRIQALVGRRVLHEDAVRGGEIFYRPYNAEMGAAIDEALLYYRDHSNRIIELIFSKPTNAIRSIADAFRFRKDD